MPLRPSTSLSRKRVRVSAGSYRKELRAEMIRAYGSECSCCGESIPEFLTLEHTRGDGGEHRAAVGRNAQAQLVDLKRRGWPQDGYTLHCFSCNLAKGKHGTCPHKREGYINQNAEHAYTAGFMDADGSFEFRHHENQWLVQCQASQTNREPLDRLTRLYGGRVYPQREATDKWKASWIWRICKREEMLAFLRAIIPYLTIKRERAELLLSILNWRKNFADLSMEELAQLEIWYEQMKEWNQRGTHQRTSETRESVKRGLTQSIGGYVETGA